ncbi:unnamed protein product [Allacma fusca]|uniref:Uncharacterized protein n=1 Tax=Allacma fusca TaxID=39272 RepID=A0A8J2JM31_9HEXA|nr:unnamed protein product [Allacma fusca]
MYNSPPIDENQDEVAQLNQQDIQLYKIFETQRSHNEQDLQTQQQFQQQQQVYDPQQQLQDWMKPKSQFQVHTLNEGDVVKNTMDNAAVQGYSLCLWNENLPSVNPGKTEIIVDGNESSNSTVNGASDELSFLEELFYEGDGLPAKDSVIQAFENVNYTSAPSSLTPPVFVPTSNPHSATTSIDPLSPKGQCAHFSFNINCPKSFKLLKLLFYKFQAGQIKVGTGFLK